MHVHDPHKSPIITSKCCSKNTLSFLWIYRIKRANSPSLKNALWFWEGHQNYQNRGMVYKGFFGKQGCDLQRFFEKRGCDLHNVLDKQGCGLLRFFDEQGWDLQRFLDKHGCGLQRFCDKQGWDLQRFLDEQGCDLQRFLDKRGVWSTKKIGQTGVWSTKIFRQIRLRSTNICGDPSTKKCLFKSWMLIGFNEDVSLKNDDWFLITTLKPTTCFFKECQKCFLLKNAKKWPRKPIFLENTSPLAVEI